MGSRRLGRGLDGVGFMTLVLRMQGSMWPSCLASLWA